jgi:hypothetical protein
MGGDFSRQAINKLKRMRTKTFVMDNFRPKEGFRVNNFILKFQQKSSIGTYPVWQRARF